MSGAQKHLIIAAGGTGGHMFPAQALAETMLRRGWRVTLSTDARGARYTGGFPHTVEVRQVASATFARGGLIAKLAVPLRILSGVMQATLRMQKERPDVVVGFGGYPSIPAMAAAWLTGRPRMLHEQNGVLGRVNRLFAKRVTAVACGTWPTALPKGVEGVPTGNPVRAAILEKGAAPYIAPGDYPLQIVIIGGSQGARILSDVVPAAMDLLPSPYRDRVRIAQQARPEDIDRVRAAYDAARIPAEIDSFFRDVPARFAAAQMIIARAGASTVADISVIGRPAILIPFAAATNDHQTANARSLVDVGAAILIPESRLTPEALSEHIAQVLSQPDAATRMAQAALSTAKPDAADRLAALVEELSGGQQGVTP